MASGRPLAVTALFALLAAAGCGGDGDRGPGLRPIRGVVLISLGHLGAGHLGAYGAARPTSPFFDRLARRGALFERAIAQSPSTLVSNASLFTGLYPQQHGVQPPARAISPSIQTLPERFSTFGYRTAGFTEGGFVARHFGFHRGFDQFRDPPARADTDVERTFDRGLDFLRSLEPGERFFLYLHSSSLAPPYEPPPPYDQRYPTAPAEPLFEPSGANLHRANRGFLVPDEATADRFEALYDAGVSYLDGVLESFFAELEQLGLVAETAVVVTADHGEEFLEHGRLGWFQVYPEVVRVPLLVLHPDVDAGRRIAELVQLIDVAPTLYELADLPPAEAIAGRSLVPLLAGGRRTPTWAYAEAGDGRRQRTLLRRADGVTHQLIETSVVGERDGTWITHAAGLELVGPDTELAVVSFHRQRRLRLRLDGDDRGEIAVGTTWMPLDLALVPGRPRYRLDLAADGCDSPRALGLSDDPRCLSFKLRGAPVRLAELFDLDGDPLAERDLAAARPALRHHLAGRLSRLQWSIVAPPQNRPLSGDTADALRAVGYLD